MTAVTVTLRPDTSAKITLDYQNDSCHHHSTPWHICENYIRLSKWRPSPSLYVLSHLQKLHYIIKMTAITITLRPDTSAKITLHYQNDSCHHHSTSWHICENYIGLSKWQPSPSLYVLTHLRKLHYIIKMTAVTITLRPDTSAKITLDYQHDGRHRHSTPWHICKIYIRLSKWQPSPSLYILTHLRKFILTIASVVTRLVVVVHSSGYPDHQNLTP